MLFGYNGFGRLTGSETGSVGGGGAGRQGGQWGPTGWTRLFNQSFGGQASWLIPAALILLVGGLVLTATRRRTDRTRAALLLWGGWLLVTGIAISLGKGIIHEYYTVALVPAIGALVGIGGAAMWRHRAHWFARGVLSVAVLATAVWAYTLLRAHARLGTRAARRWSSSAGSSWRSHSLFPLRGKLAGAVLAAALIVGLAAPTAYSLVDRAHGAHRRAPDRGTGRRRTRLRSRRRRRTRRAVPAAHEASHPAAPAGPRTERSGRRPASAVRAPPAARAASPAAPANGHARRRRRDRRDGRPAERHHRLVPAVDAAPAGAATATAGPRRRSAPTTPRATSSRRGRRSWRSAASTAVTRRRRSPQFQSYVRQHAVHYFIGGGGGGGAGGPGGSSGTSSAISTWVAANFTATTVGGVTVYDLSSGAA